MAAGSELGRLGCMFFRRSQKSWQVETLSEKFRREHSEFLTFALWSKLPFPRIPVRSVKDGGFDELLRRQRGREVTERWWRRALRLVWDSEQ